MITADFVRLMARYNRWQNESLYGAADTLNDAARRLDRGAFFRSIHETLSHIVWGDEIWFSRFTNHPAPGGGIAGSTARFQGWAELCEKRRALDSAIDDWAAALSDADLGGDFDWFSGALGREVSRPKALLVAHMFNHQTHHRGQVHAMLTAAGATPKDTDLFMTPGL